MDEIGEIPDNLARRIKYDGDYSQELRVEVGYSDDGDGIKVSITNMVGGKGYYILFNDEDLSIQEVIDYMNGEGNVARVVRNYLSAGPI